MNAVCASENFDAFIAFRLPPNLRTKPENSNPKRGLFAGVDHRRT